MRGRAEIRDDQRQSSTHDKALREELITVLFANLPRAMLAVVVVAGVVVFVLWESSGGVGLLSWWGSLALLAAARMALRHRWRRVGDRHPVGFWERRFRLGALATALAWAASVPLFMWGAPQVEQMFLAFILAGMTSGAVPSLAADLRLLLTYIFLLMLPAAGVLAVQAGGVGQAMAAVILIYLGMMTTAAIEYHRTLRRAIADRHSLAAREREAHQLFEHVPTGVFYYDRELRLQDCNEAFTHTVGVEKGRLCGLDLSRLRDDRILPTLKIPIEEGREARYQGEYLTHFSQLRRYGEIHVAPLFDEEGNIKGAIGAIQDRTGEHEAMAELERLALYDPLTGLPNRKLFQERLRACLGQIGRNGRVAALLYLDLDDFKCVNDSHGHEAGDRLLMAFARRVQGILRAQDTLARLGGDEFVVLAVDLGADSGEIMRHGQRVADKIHALCMEGFDIGDCQVHTTASVGLVVVEAGADMEELLRRADTAMYRAKAAGKGQTAFYEEAMDQAAREYSRTIERLRVAVAEGGFELRFQPIVRLVDGRLVGAEALLRWHDPELGEVGPTRFIPIAEESRLIEEIGRWVLEAVCRQWAEWRDRGRLGALRYLSINVSPRELRNADYPDRLAAVMRRYRIDPAEIHLEITESVLAEDIRSMSKILERIEAMGVHCMLDDFGTGYSSLRYLKRLPVSTIKVDREFVRNLETDSGDAALIGAVVEIAEQFGYQVVAEGVEHAAQRDILLGMNRDLLAQGYLFSPPLTAAELIEYAQAANAEAASPARRDG